jgi:single-strand DNA-binding protein
MSNLRNSVKLIGFLGAAPEIKELANKKMLVRVNIATNDSYKNEKGEKVEETQWHQLVLWDKQAEIAAQYLMKGSEVAVEGKLTSRSYTDKEGVKRYVTEIVVSEFVMLGKSKSAAIASL